MSQSSIEPQGEYVVERILEKRFRSGGKPEYKVKWKGYSEADTTWEPIQNLRKYYVLIDAFENKQDQADGHSMSSEPKAKGRKNSSSESRTRKHKPKRKSSSSSSDSSRKKRRTSKRPQSSSSRDSGDQKGKTKPKKGKNSSSSSSRSRSRSDRKKTVTKEPLNPKKGSLELGDTPKDIENLRKDMKNQKVQFLVSWNTRKDNKVPLPTWLTDQELRDAAPKVLCDFLMRKIKWPSKKPK